MGEDKLPEKRKYILSKLIALFSTGNSQVEMKKEVINIEILAPYEKGKITEKQAIAKWQELFPKHLVKEPNQIDAERHVSVQPDAVTSQSPVAAVEIVSAPSTIDQRIDNSSAHNSADQIDHGAEVPAAIADMPSEDCSAVSDVCETAVETLLNSASQISEQDHDTNEISHEAACTTPVEFEPPKPRPKPEWKNLEPVDRSDPVAHEEASYIEIGDNWYIMAASVRGKLHAHTGTWRDDSFIFSQSGNWSIMAVADGAGSAPLSRVGSRIACDASMAHLNLLLEDFSLPLSDGDTPKTSALEKVKAFLVSAATEGRNAIIREAHQRSKPLKAFNTTLLLVLHVKWKQMDVIAAIQVGDGAVGIYDTENKCTLLGVADHGQHTSETIFLTSTNELAKKSLDQRVVFSVKNNLQALAIMSDGISDDFFPENEMLVQLFNGDPTDRLRTKEGDPVYGLMKEVCPNPRNGDALLDWMHYEKKQSSDDRTLLVMARKREDQVSHVND